MVVFESEFSVRSKNKKILIDNHFPEEKVNEIGSNLVQCSVRNRMLLFQIAYPDLCGRSEDPGNRLLHIDTDII